MRFLRLMLAMAGLMLALFHPAVQAQVTEAEGPQAEAAEADPSFRWEGRITNPSISKAELSHLLVPLTKQQLESVSGEWLKIVQDKTSEISLLQAERVRNPAELQDERTERIVALVEQRARLLERYTLVVDSLERKGGDEALVNELRAYRSSILYEETSLASAGALVGSALAWLGRRDGGIAVLLSISIAIIALGAIVFVARLARGGARFWIGRRTSLSKLLQNFLVGAFYWLFILIGLLVVLSAIDIDITPLFAVIGGASFILAFAFQDTLGNLASGLMIMINQPFDEEDFIEVGGVAGTVKKVSIVGTTIATPDNKIIVVPNKNVWGNVIVNASASDIRRVDLTFGASYDDPIQTVLETINDVVSAHPKILEEPAPQVQANELSASSVNYICRPWVRSDDYIEVYWDLTRQVKEAFDKNGLSMPYPQQDVHLRSGPLPA